MINAFNQLQVLAFSLIIDDQSCHFNGAEFITYVQMPLCVLQIL